MDINVNKPEYDRFCRIEHMILSNGSEQKINSSPELEEMTMSVRVRVVERHTAKGR